MKYNFNIDDLTIRKVADRLFEAEITPIFPDRHTEILSRTPYPDDIITDYSVFLAWEDFCELPMSTVKEIRPHTNGREILFVMGEDFSELAFGDYETLYEE